VDLTAHYVASSRQVIAGIESADITSPDHPRSYLVSLTTRATGMLGVMADHAERLATKTENLTKEVNRLAEEKDQLTAQVRSLESLIAALRSEATQNA
jgi:ABC-type transporter Mla subunit MlaD